MAQAANTMSSPTIFEKIEAVAAEPIEWVFSTLIRDDGSLQDISYRHFSSIINRAAAWMDENLPLPISASNFPTFLYVGDVNLRILALLVAGAKTGRKMLLVRRYALPEVLNHLIAATDCHTFLYEYFEDRPKSCKDDRDAIRLTLPAWDLWFASPESTLYVPQLTRKRTMDDHICVFHTSGSTGTISRQWSIRNGAALTATYPGKPKPVIYTHRKLTCFDSIKYIGEELNLHGARMVSTFPLIHAGGATTSLFWPIYLGQIPVLREIGVPNTPEEVERMLRISGASLLAVQPSILSAISISSSMVSTLRQQLSFVLTGSAPLSKAIVDVFQQDNGPYVHNMYGSTETLPLRQNRSDPEDWPYISFKADSGISFCHETDDLYELVVQKDVESRDQTLSAFCSFPDQHIFRSKDLFIPHPQKPALWRFACRKDDLLSLATGQGINIGPMEMTLSECPLVDTAIVGLDGRPTTILLIIPQAKSPRDSPMNDKEESVREAVWPYVERANKEAHPAAAIQKDMILVLPERHEISSATTDKGSVKRQVLFKQFEYEIAEMYSGAGQQ